MHLYSGLGGVVMGAYRIDILKFISITKWLIRTKLHEIKIHTVTSLKQIFNKYFIKKNKKVATTSATERDTFIWDVPHKSHTTKKPDIPELFVHMNNVPETFENAPQTHATCSTVTSDTIAHSCIRPNNNPNSLNNEKDVHKPISTEIPEHINELKKEIHDTTCINTTESKSSTKTQTDPDGTSTSSDVNQSYSDTVTDPDIEITNNSKICPDTKKIFKENEFSESPYENLTIETDSKCINASEIKTVANNKLVATPEAITLFNKSDPVQETTIDTNHVECPHIANNIIFKFSVPPLILPNTTKFRFIIGTKKEDIYKENCATKSTIKMIPSTLQTDR